MSPIVEIVGIPSGEILETTLYTLDSLRMYKLIYYDSRIGCYCFDDGFRKDILMVIGSEKTDRQAYYEDDLSLPWNEVKRFENFDFQEDWEEEDINIRWLNTNKSLDKTYIKVRVSDWKEFISKIKKYDVKWGINILDIELPIDKITPGSVNGFYYVYLYETDKGIRISYTTYQVSRIRVFGYEKIKDRL